MRDNLWIIVLGFVIVIALIMAHYNSTQEKLDVIHQDVIEQNYKDSLYLDHLEHCAYVASDEIKLDSRGYLYSQYKKTNGLKP